MLPFFVVMAGLIALLLIVVKKGRGGLEWLVKPLASATFIAAGLYAGALSTAWGTVLFAGLVFAALGDVFLIPEGRRWFVIGLGSFLLGHLGYAVAFVVRGVALEATAIGALAMTLVTVPVVRWIWPHLPPRMRLPVGLYLLTISSMIAVAAGTYGAHGGPLILIGAIVFYISDILVARDRFVDKAFLNRAISLPLYFFSQLILATSVMS